MHTKIILCAVIKLETRHEGKWTHYKISEHGSAAAQMLLTAITTPNKKMGK